MSAEYDDLRSDLDCVQREFENLGSGNPDLHHQVCYVDDEPLSGATWDAFKKHYMKLPDGKWHDWHVLNDGRWLGRFFGTGSLELQFVPLATEAVSILERLLAVPGLGERFFVTLPAQCTWLAWLPFLYSAGELHGMPEVEDGYWGIAAKHVAPLAFSAYWSKPDVDGTSFPLHPKCMTLVTDVFRASAQSLKWMLEPPSSSITEYRDLLQYSDLWVPPYLPANLWELSPEESDRVFSDAIEEWAAGELAKEEMEPRPQWNKTLGELRLGNKVVKTLRRDGFRGGKVLDAFEIADWPEWIPDPFEKRSRNEVHEAVQPEVIKRDEKLLSDTVRQLNKNQKEAKITFRNMSSGVAWRVPTQPPQSSD